MRKKVRKMIKDRKFITLQKKWYAKLREEGFNDIEYFYEDMEPRDILKKTLTSKIKDAADADNMVYTELFYSHSRQYYWDTTFEDPLDKQIWFLFSEGTPYLKIAKQLSTTYSIVFKKITHYKKDMLEKLKQN
jgi:hypothetical protein